MKVGILTLPLLDNYGGMLQAAALYRVLQDLGHTPVLINKKYYHGRLVLLLARCLRYFPGHDIAKIKTNQVKRKLHKPFMENFIGYKTREVYTLRGFRSVCQKEGLDAVVVGSDQVWRAQYIKRVDVPTYFLDLDISIRKISYAASFGTSRWESEETKPLASKFLKEFDFVSVRESSGVDICRAELGVANCTQVLDPTLIVDFSFYDDVLKNVSSKQEGKYVLSYVLDKAQEIKKAVEIAEVQRDVSKVVRMSLQLSEGILTVPDWLGMFSNADYVVTDSFHGVVVSIVFKKQFLAIANVDRGIDRFESLLKICGLSDRLITQNDTDQVAAIASVGIDYDLVHARLKESKLDSKIFIGSALS